MLNVLGKVAGLSYQEKGDKVRNYTYTYASDDRPLKSTLPDSSVESNSYDSLRRNTKTVYTPKKDAADSKKLYTTVKYWNGEASSSDRKGTTGNVSQYINRFGSNGKIVSRIEK